MDLPGRKMSLVFRRNEAKDEQVGGIEYTGYDLYWPSGRRVQGLAFDRFCKIGMRYILGRDKPPVAAMDVYFVPLADREALLPRIPGHRMRVLILERTGRRLQMVLSDETPTEIVFDLDQDEEAMLEWLGARDVPDGGRQWFAFYAVRTSDEVEVLPGQGRARRTGARRGAHRPKGAAAPFQGANGGMNSVPSVSDW